MNDPTISAHPATTTTSDPAIMPSSTAALHHDLLTTSTLDGTPALTTKPAPQPTGPTPATKATTTSSQPTVTGLRQRVNTVGAQLDQATNHPAVKDAKKGALKQIDQFRQFLGRSPALVNAEKRTGVDRVILVAGGVLLYILLIPLNFLHLALFTTTLLTFVPPMLLAVRVLDNPNEQRTKLLLSYFTVFGFVSFAESLMADFLMRTVPQYYTVKLLFLAYLIHPRTKGALKVHEAVLRPLLAQRSSPSTAPRSSPTPPSSRPFGSSGSSPTQFPTGPTGSELGAQSTLSGYPLPSGGGTGVGGEAPRAPLA